jgi:diguanylate cyclase
MRYTEAKEKSAELLRLALSYMGRHSAALNPFTYTLWYEYAAGTNPSLNAAVDGLLRQAAVVDDAQVLALCQRHVFPPDQASLDRIRGDMQQLMHGVALSATEASRDAGDYGAQLSELSAALNSNDTQALRPQVDDMLASTVRMKQSVDQLRSQVQASQGEVDKLRQALESARNEALTDPMTGICNRAGFAKRLQAMLCDAPGAGRSHAFVMLDIDHFKKVNDTHGHLVGDRVIQAMGEILRVAIKSAGATVARYGGEEFAVLLPDTAPQELQRTVEGLQAHTKALKIRNRQTQEVLVTITVSGGVAYWRDGESADELIARADAALYTSKQSGRDRFTHA